MVNGKTDYLMALEGSSTMTGQFTKAASNRVWQSVKMLFSSNSKQFSTRDQ